MKAAVIGSGSWGTAFAKVLGEAGSEVRMWARREAVATEIREKGSNEGSLPGIRLGPTVTGTTDLAEAVTGAELIAIAVPAQTLRGNLADWAGSFPGDATVVSLMKGIELGTLKRMSEVIVETAGVAPDRVVVVSGPNLAPEIAAGQPTATVVACSDESRARQVQHALATPHFRPYTSDDVIGCELGGACKNVIALAYGMAVAIGLGDNTRASLITRGLAETARLGVALGADPLTFAGLAGLGDLVASCSSPLARNRTFGEHLGRGDSLEQAQIATRQTAEGVKSCLSIRDLARANGVEMPIVEQVERVCHEGVDPRVAVKLLMTREMKPE
ncbi:NAD(P)-dependent glycerol-3-phosphate dehydrogenase [Actinoplanes hulinensis]|uniref:Glycerol-3-phosphate dehydrogenase [NAD(P)+] n=2 Tax=Actinoplanes TaxID=1865 RepID=A0A7W5AC06_9ACTN|nr:MULTISPECIES: NAD(P)H-dependent glycerol-3-phosphate dehydrogenase [Actinoplanes]MBB3093169.1 glycerol-3-phosphate dehydrogenase (NAD(P)+) [Actinoplanes campanulatus]MBW6437843.1 NAD(P)-dependent glycerol-3-phosphate dehydrogenase [Actinoplanes hulinensis]GGN01665.1 glycerol-3-phosphate dehydrogenase [NAD(P)+] [Actinoplanes campanulatus]GID33735.1 glycerol-3-phosphate dehydrogenase [NAD(P)+] [Actinoplanes campanulatus]GID44117.1 glycerol-3-phosphate dehydrogenase [NAD(P)+] [Actinoplanes cap